MAVGQKQLAEALKPPRPVKREIDVLTRDQVRILLRTAQRTQPKLYALYALAVTTGARQGELLALQHGDVDLDTGTIGINRSVYNGVVSDPKTASSRRTIRLSKLALEALRDHLNTYVGTYGYSPRPKTPPLVATTSTTAVGNRYSGPQGCRKKPGFMTRGTVQLLCS